MYSHRVHIANTLPKINVFGTALRAADSAKYRSSVQGTPASLRAGTHSFACSLFRRLRTKRKDLLVSCYVHCDKTWFKRGGVVALHKRGAKSEGSLSLTVARCQQIKFTTPHDSSTHTPRSCIDSWVNSLTRYLRRPSLPLAECLLRAATFCRTSHFTCTCRQTYTESWERRFFFGLELLLTTVKCDVLEKNAQSFRD